MRINLLPPEILERQRARRRTLGVVALGIVLLLVLGAFYVLQLIRLGNLEEDLADQQAVNRQLQAQIAELRDVEALQQQLADSRELLGDILANQVYWSGVLRDVALVIPGETWLTGLTGAISEAQVEGAPEVQTGAGLVGSISFTGFAFEHRDVALWLSRLEDVRGFINPWLSTSTKTLIGTTEVVSFTNSVDLSEQALARRGGSE